MTAALIGPEDQRWSTHLGNADADFYHLPTYASLCAAWDKGEAAALFAEEGEHSLLVPMVVRSLPAALTQGDVPEGLRDAISPYGYPGVLASRGASDDFVAEALEDLVVLLKEKQIVTLFTRLHGFSSPSDELLRTCGDLVEHGETVSIDLTQSEDDLWSQTRSNHRRGINKAMRLGHSVRMDSSKLDDFHACYLETMGRVSATEYYLFDRTYMAHLLELLGDHGHLAVVEIEGEVACAGLFTTFGGCVQYHLGGTRDAALEHSPMKVLFHFVRSWAKERGERVFHLGGGAGSKEDPLFHFKEGFSDRRHRFKTWRVVGDEVLLDRLCAVRATQTEDPPPAGFFPPYRAPE